MYTVLIVDDEDCLRQTFADILQAEGYTVFTAGDAETARAQLETGTIDVVVTDIVMPGRSGVELLREMRQAAPDVVFLMITGDPAVSTATDALRLGALDYLSKPVRRADLCRAVARAAQEKAARDSYRQRVEQNDRQRVRLENTVQAQGRELASAYEFIKELAVLTSLEETLETIVRRVAQRLRCRRVSILLKEDTSDDLVLRAAVGVPYELINTARVKVGQPICGTVFAERKPCICNNVSTGTLSSVSGQPAQDPLLSESTRRYRVYVSLPIMAASPSPRSYALGVLNATERDGDLPFAPEDLRAVEYMADAAAVAIHNQLNMRSLERMTFETLRALISAVEARDAYTCGHTLRVTRNAVLLGQRLNLSPEDLRAIETGGALHDIGKIGVPDAILGKPGKLTPEEFQIIKNHTVMGARMVSHLSFLSRALDVIRHHHERYDGRGYPEGLAGEEIPITARVVAVADTFDAVTSSRPYHPARPVEEALNLLRENRGTQFDPRCVDAFLELAAERKLLIWDEAGNTTPAPEVALAMTAA